ncbi:MAG: hypothetical protein ACLR5G_00535 [Eubacteriales bacterium]
MLNQPSRNTEDREPLRHDRFDSARRILDANGLGDVRIAHVSAT